MINCQPAATNKACHGIDPLTAGTTHVGRQRTQKRSDTDIHTDMNVYTDTDTDTETDIETDSDTHKKKDTDTLTDINVNTNTDPATEGNKDTDTDTARTESTGCEHAVQPIARLSEPVYREAIMVPTITVSDLDVTPNDCALGDPLDLKVIHNSRSHTI